MAIKSLKTLGMWVIGGLVLYHFLKRNKEGMSSSRGTFIQLAAASGYYPFWRYGYGYRYPYYRYMMPYYDYTSERGGRSKGWGGSSNITYPKPHGYYINY